MFKSYASSGLVVAGALAASMLFPISASAVPFTITSVTNFDCVTPPTPVGLTCTPKVLTWKTPETTVSKLTLTDLATSALINSGDPAINITQLTHDNVIIPQAYNYFRNINNNVTLLEGAPPGGTELVNDSNTIGINFTETVNSTPCTFPTPAGTICDDFFDFTAGGLDPVSFISGGIKYNLIFDLVLGNGAFFDGVKPNRVYTAESASSDLFVTARIEAVDVPIPEPVTLALLGLGLLGIGFTTRQRKIM